MKRLACLLAISLVAVAAALAAGADPDDPADWQRRIREARAVVAQAQVRQTAAENAYTEMRHRKYPRGEARVAVAAERTAARDDAARAQRDLDLLLQQARRAGAPPGWLRATEAAPAAPDVSDVEAAEAADLPTDAPTADDDTESAAPADLPYEAPVEAD
ncbi:MAG TPA: hypothetical protein VFC77_02015 [Myxococcota bacterium]|nr:hypothetical protein [Myxococcota bacterium]